MSESEAGPQERRRVIVVDDDPGFRRYVAESLRTAGYEVVEAEDGFDAETACLAHPPDAVVTDLVMPGKEGVGFVFDLHARRPEVPIIAITGRTDAFGSCYLAAAASAGAVATLRKPFPPEALLERLRGLLAAAERARA